MYVSACYTQERTINLSILTMSGPGKSPRVMLNNTNIMCHESRYFARLINHEHVQHHKSGKGLFAFDTVPCMTAIILMRQRCVHAYTYTTYQNTQHTQTHTHTHTCHGNSDSRLAVIATRATDILTYYTITYYHILCHP